MVERAGLSTRQQTAILFIPGWLRMLDLWCYTRVRPLARFTSALVQPFVWLDRHVPAVRRHGYLTVNVCEKRSATPVVDALAMPAAPSSGVEYVIDAHGCRPAVLRSEAMLRQLFAEVITSLKLRAVAEPLWHVFPGHAGVTGIMLLAESHISIHTYPETGLAAINLYCCRPHAEWPWEERLKTLLGAATVTVRVVPRGRS
jgi:S-adenosylmethionine decarboxylase